MRCFIAVLVITAALLSTAAAQDCAEEVTIEAFDGTIAIYHRETRFNCCSWINVEVAQDGYDIGVVEWEMFDDGPCFCLCCFDVAATIGGLAPGDYMIEIQKAYYVGGDEWVFELVGTWVITVDGVSDPFVEYWYIPCPMAGADELPPPPASWGTIKALYK